MGILSPHPLRDLFGIVWTGQGEECSPAGVVDVEMSRFEKVDAEQHIDSDRLSGEISGDKRHTCRKLILEENIGYPDSLVGTCIVHYSPVTDFVVGKDD